MENSFFSIEEAAKILGCGIRQVQRLIAEDWLNRPTGGAERDRVARVTQKSLFQFMIIDHVSHFPIKTLRQFKSGRKNFGRFLRHFEGLSRFSMDEGAGRATAATSASSDSLPKNDEPERCLHHDWAAEHQFSFGWCARQLAPDDPALQDDLVQEMSLAVLEYDKPASFEYLFELASNRAKDYLKYEERRGMQSLSEARQVNDSVMEKMAGLKTLIERLTRRGVPAEWIEELLGEEQEVA